MTQGTLLGGRFEIGELLGQGGMGQVYYGVDTGTSAPVAIKRLKPEAVVKNPEQVERFRREAEALYQLDHPNIVKIIDAVYENGEYCIVMEYMGGGSLRDMLKREQRLSIPYTLNLALDLSDALTRAHRLKIIHRDMKPDNVLLTEDGVPRLTDFGQAHFTNAATITRAGQVIGTLNYMPPEILRGEAADARSDIWSFGVMLYEMLSGYRPFMGENSADLITAILKQPIPYVQRLRSDCPPGLAKLVHAMLERDREQRIASVREIGLQIEQVLSDLEAAAGGEAD